MDRTCEIVTHHPVQFEKSSTISRKARRDRLALLRESADAAVRRGPANLPGRLQTARASDMGARQRGLPGDQLRQQPVEPVHGLHPQPDQLNSSVGNELPVPHNSSSPPDRDPRCSRPAPRHHGTPASGRPRLIAIRRVVRICGLGLRWRTRSDALSGDPGEVAAVEGHQDLAAVSSAAFGEGVTDDLLVPDGERNRLRSRPGGDGETAGWRSTVLVGSSGGGVVAAGHVGS